MTIEPKKEHIRSECSFKIFTLKLCNILNGRLNLPNKLRIFMVLVSSLCRILDNGEAQCDLLWCHTIHTRIQYPAFFQSIQMNFFYFFINKKRIKIYQHKKVEWLFSKRFQWNEKDKFSATEETVPRSAVLQSLFRMYPWLRLSIALLLFNAQ